MAEENKNSAPAKVSTNAVKRLRPSCPSRQAGIQVVPRDAQRDQEGHLADPKQVVNNTGVALGMMIVFGARPLGFRHPGQAGRSDAHRPGVRRNGGRSEVVCSPHLLRL